jgi:predicted dehydrogenase
VLMDHGMRTEVVGRSRDGAEAFEEATGVPAASGGIETWLSGQEQPPEQAVVAVSVAELTATVLCLLEGGVSRILVEKPAGLTVDELGHIEAEAERRGVDVRIAYNRRFLSSVLRARELIEEDGGVTSFTFDFTELARVVAATKHPDHVKASWVLVNSSHVIDLAFHLGGWPTTLQCQVDGKLDWHPTGSRFTGHGLTDLGASFAYHADWESPGRWGVELRTRHRRLRLQPLERLAQQVHGSFEEVEVPIDGALDQRFKPGLHREVGEFLGDFSTELAPSLGEHRRLVAEVIVPIATGRPDHVGV